MPSRWKEKAKFFRFLMWSNLKMTLAYPPQVWPPGLPPIVMGLVTALVNVPIKEARRVGLVQAGNSSRMSCISSFITYE